MSGSWSFRRPRGRRGCYALYTPLFGTKCGIVQGRLRFAPEYVSCVLDENFEDAKALFLSPLMAIHYAHLAMLVEQGIVGRAEGRILTDALDSISLPDVRQVQYDGSYEDLFFYLERLVVEKAGEDAAGRLHTAR